MMEQIDLDQLNILHPKLRPYVKVLLTHEFGLLRELPSIHNIQCGSIVRKNQILYGDRFQLKIWYCRKPLNWHVIMSCHEVTKAPDFIMEENFLADATPETVKTKVPSLANWCPTDVRCLLNVVLELLELYKSHQVNLLRESPSLHRYLFEYDTLLSMAGLNENDIEVCAQVRNPVVIFLIHLNVDFSKLPAALPDSKDLAVFVVEFKDNAKNSVQVILRIELEDSLGGRIELPDLSPDMSLMDFVPAVELLLQKKVEKVIEQTHQRKMLYSYLVQFFEPSLINGDNINFTNVSFLLELEGFYCVLSVHIPLDYPQARPNLQLLSFNKPKSASSPEYNSFPYNQNMSHEDVARSIFTFVKDGAISKLKKATFAEPLARISCTGAVLNRYFESEGNFTLPSWYPLPGFSASFSIPIGLQKLNQPVGNMKKCRMTRKTTQKAENDKSVLENITCCIAV